MALPTLIPVALSNRHQRLFLSIVRAVIPIGDTLDVPVDEKDVLTKVGLTLADTLAR